MPRIVPAALMLLALAATPAVALDTAARAALVVDHDTGAVLLAKNAEEPLPPASMSKLMTIAMIYEALKDGRLSLDHRVTASARATAIKGSSMFLRQGEEVAIRDVIPGIIVQSGNDACVAVAEALAGSEDGFARRMTERARELGMRHTTLRNASGWPDPDHRMSMEDLVILARHLIRDFPDDPAKPGDYGDFAQRDFPFDGRVPTNSRNRNPLLGRVIGGDPDIVVDGLKTGHTEEAGYGLVASATRNGRRVVLAVTGLPTEAARREETGRLIAWAFREFENRRLFEPGAVLAEAEVWLGAEDRVALVAPDGVLATLPVVGGEATRLRIVYAGPVEAPVAKGQAIARLEITAPGLAPVSVPLVAAADVARGNFLVKVTTTARVLVSDLFGGP